MSVLHGAIRNGVVKARQDRETVLAALAHAEENVSALRDRLNHAIDNTAEWEFEAEQAGVDLPGYDMTGQPIAGPSGNKITGKQIGGYTQ